MTDRKVEHFMKEICKLIMEDFVALQKLSVLKDALVREPSINLHVGKLLSEYRFHEAITMALQAWTSSDSDQATIGNLIAVLRDNGLNSLAGRLETATQNVDSPFQEIGTECERLKRSITIWFDVGDVIHNFVGREKELDELHELLIKTRERQDSSIALVAGLRGLGGVGKSTLARKYAHSKHEFYGGNVVWVNSDSIDSMRNSFKRLATQFGCTLQDERIPNRDLANKIYEKFHSVKCLFIFDNVEEFNDLQEFRPNDLIPGTQRPFVLLTSRKADVAPAAQVLHLDVLTHEEAVRFILEEVPGSSQADASELAIKLQCLPLALQQAAAYIQDAFIPEAPKTQIAKYMESLERNSKGLLNDTRFQAMNDYTRTTLNTWSTTLEKLRAVDRENGNLALQTLMNLLSYLNPFYISLEFLQLFFNGSGEEIELERSVAILAKFSMVSTDGLIGGNKVHRLVQTVIRSTLETSDEVALIRKIIAVIFAQHQSKIEFNALTRESTSHGLYLVQLFLPHSQITAELPTGNFLSHLCWYVSEYGLLQDHLITSSKCLKEISKAHGPDHQNSLRMATTLALAHYRLNDFKEGLRCLDEYVPLALEILGKRHDTSIEMQNIKGILLMELGEHEKAIQLYEEFIPIMTEVKGKNDRATLVLLHNKALTLHKIGRNADALPILESVHKEQVRFQGAEHPVTVNTRGWISCVLFELGDHARGLEMCQEVAEIRLNSLGPNHPHTKHSQKKVMEMEKIVAESQASFASKHCAIS